MRVTQERGRRHWGVRGRGEGRFVSPGLSFPICQSKVEGSNHLLSPFSGQGQGA